MERDLERYFNKRVREAGGMALKFKSPGYTGVADRLAITSDGRIIMAELKNGERGSLKPRQKVVIDRLAKFSTKVWVIYDRQDVETFIAVLF